MKRLIFLLSAGVCVCTQSWSAPPKTATINDINDQRNTLIALTGATVYTDANTSVNNATVLIRDGRIISVKSAQQAPNNALVKDYSGLTIYPGFIHLDSSVGLPAAKPRAQFSFGKPETISSTIKGAYNGNEAIKASFNAATVFKTDSKTNAKLRKAGFTSALSHNKDGIMRGTSALISLADEADQLNIIKSQAANHFSFDKGSSKQNYPISLMGAVALIRQTFMDADWYTQQNSMVDLDLEAVNAQSKLPRLFTTRSWQQTLLVDTIANEFDTTFVVRTKGDSYEDLQSVKNTGQTLIVPLNARKAPQVNDPFDSWNVDLKDLKKWEIEPFNPTLLEKNKIRFALLPADDDKDAGKFLKALRTSVEHGLSKTTALAALTSVPANILKQKDMGHLKAGARADFIVTTGDLFAKDTQLAQTWIGGQSYDINGIPPMAPGHYQLAFADQSLGIKLSYAKGKLSLKPADKEDKTKYKVSMDEGFMQVRVTPEEGEPTSLFGLLNGSSITPLADSINWSLKPGEHAEEASKEKEAKTLPEIPYPFAAYGYAEPQKHDAILFKNATVWTNEDDGILENTDVLIRKGKISEIGTNLSAANAVEIDATGKHLTAGIVDEHAHIALLSVNDIAVNSGMVRMQDVVNSHDVNIYRNLAGGVTAAQLLHGSANPIGGQSALVKLRWGTSPAGMLIDGSDGFIKFALGENVKRSSNSQSIRYPLTRMGVEQVYRDGFTQARAYEQEMQAYNKLNKRRKAEVDAPRKDLALDALVEIMNEERFISCHSYVQSEINMLMHVADDFDFKVNTFTHILEGYKVADKMREHGAGGSTFSDWWAYKWEVNFAIPHNAALMAKAGVVTAINSDSAEMSRRLNQEAAKSVKYGNLSEEEAWKMVTLNPAKLLHLDDRMGSIKNGKDADVVLWSDNPLSIYAMAEKTLVDGVVYFDRDQQAAIEDKIEAEKQRLIAKAAGEDNTGGKPFMSAPQTLLHCDTILEAGLFHEERLHGEVQ
ncbi:amidohydrolase family protein [Marinicella sp. W31]|uniref:amidohydrolase family protein n=1 Tax=Marinicella sp. W31 TaxID=3023713 RepID=UPI0037572659